MRLPACLPNLPYLPAHLPILLPACAPANRACLPILPVVLTSMSYTFALRRWLIQTCIAERWRVRRRQEGETIEDFGLQGSAGVVARSGREAARGGDDWGFGASRFRWGGGEKRERGAGEKIEGFHANLVFAATIQLYSGVLKFSRSRARTSSGGCGGSASTGSSKPWLPLSIPSS